jgi:hypothetical protein
MNLRTYLALEYDLPNLIDKREIKMPNSLKTYGKMDKESKNKGNSYKECLEKSKNKKMSLCVEGYCTAKEKYEVYPSAYANAYAAQVCKGNKADMNGNYVNHYEGEKKGDTNLNRWFSEKWVNVCEKKPNGEYETCGRKKADLDESTYPYCRPLNKLPGTTVKTVGELSKTEISNMCDKKRSLEQGIDKKPTRVYLSK